VQSAVDASISSIIGADILDGALVRVVTHSGAGRIINHGLGRPVRGYLVARCNTLVLLTDSSVEVPNPLLQFAVDVTTLGVGVPPPVDLTLWVF